MAQGRTEQPFVEEVPRLLEAHALSIRELARRTGVTDSYLSRVLRKINYKTPSGNLAARVALSLGLPEDYFAEYREAFVVERVRRDANLRETLYDKLQGSK